MSGPIKRRTNLLFAFRFILVVNISKWEWKKFRTTACSKLHHFKESLQESKDVLLISTGNTGLNQEDTVFKLTKVVSFIHYSVSESYNTFQRQNLGCLLHYALMVTAKCALTFLELLMFSQTSLGQSTWTLHFVSVPASWWCLCVSIKNDCSILNIPPLVIFPK